MCVLCVFSLVELAATSMEQELQRSRSQEDAWNSSAMDLVRASDVSSSLEHYLQQSTFCTRAGLTSVRMSLGPLPLHGGEAVCGQVGAGG